MIRLTLISLVICSILLPVLANELKIEVTHKPENCERLTKKHDMLSMHYRGMLESDGSEFDSSYSRKEPFKFQLGTGQVIRGWDQGLLDMCVGEKRILTIPSHLAYGENGAGDKIPPKATLKFEVELHKIEDGESPANIFKDIDEDGDLQLSREEVRLLFTLLILIDLETLYLNFFFFFLFEFLGQQVFAQSNS